MNVISIIKYFSTVMQGRESCVSATQDIFFYIIIQGLALIYMHSYGHNYLENKHK